MRRRAVGGMAIAVGLVLVYNGLTFSLALNSDAGKPRNPETGIFVGAEPRDLGPEDAANAALFIHGYGGAGTDFADLPEKLAGEGWRVRIMLLPGHGTTPREMARQTPDDMLEAARAEVEALREKHDKIILLSHSMGGAISAIIASETKVDGLVLGAPYFGVTYRWYYILPPEIWAKITSPIFRRVYKGKLFMQVNKKEAKDKIISYEWMHSSTINMLTALGRRASSAETLSEITCPILLMYGPGDIAASPKAAKRAVDKMASEDKRTVVLKKSNHHVYWDYDQEEVFNETLAFVRKISGENDAREAGGRE